jgi:pyruvate dehydrogenase E2 component (dihydrolipoamide acetyltransferase)
MPTEITMPQLSDTMTEGTLVKWYKKEGDAVKSGEKIADIETDKAVMEMESFDDGTLAQIIAEEGAKVPVGAPIALLAVGSEKVEEVKKSAGGKAAAPQARAQAKSERQSAPSQPTAGGEVGTATLDDFSNGEVHDLGDTLHGATHDDFHREPPEPAGGHGERVRVSPLARRIARDMGIDLKLVRGTGPGGRIIQRDVLSYTAAAQKPAPAPAGKAGEKRAPKPSISLAPKLAPGQKKATPLTKMRTVIAQRLQQSKQQIPHFYETVDVDVTDLSRLREQMNRALEAEGVRLSLADLIAKAVSQALLAHPALNAHFVKDQIIQYGDVHLGMAVALPEGLIVPVLRNLNQLSLRDIRTKSADLIERARKQQLKQNEMTGATFTVTNLGTYGIREFGAIINPPEVGILAIGAAEKRVLVIDDAPAVRTMMTLTLSADHRAVDGAGAAEFLRTLKTILEEPGMMLV